MSDFHRIKRLPPYVFESVNRVKAAARNAGADIIDLGMGNPDLPTAPHIVAKLAEAAANPRAHGYSASRGIPGLRRAQAAYYERRFGVTLNPLAATIEALTDVPCRPCHKPTCKMLHHRCMRDIAVEDVTAAALRAGVRVDKREQDAMMAQAARVLRANGDTASASTRR